MDNPYTRSNTLERIYSWCVLTPIGLIAFALAFQLRFGAMPWGM